MMKLKGSVRLMSSVLKCRHLSQYNNVSSRRNTFKVINSTVDTQSKEFLTNQERYNVQEERYTQLLNVAVSGGSEKAKARHAQQKKLLATERLNKMLDSETKDDFLELSPLCGMSMEYGDVPRAGIITGIGRVNGIYCVFIVNDATVKGGTIYPIAVKKQLRAQEVAIMNRLPCVYIVDSGGAFLPLQADIFPDKEHGGRTFANEAILNSLNIPQLAVVVGMCTAGGAYVPTMAQENIMVHKIGTIFLGGPPLVQAALGEVVSAEALGGATMHSSVSGCTDHYAATEEEGYDTGRDVIASYNIQEVPDLIGYDEPLYDPNELPGCIPASGQHTMDMYQVIARIVDGSRFQEFKSKYGTSLVTGFAYIQGHLVGIVGNNGDITADAASKGAHFVQLCCQRKIPLVFLQNTTSGTVEVTSADEAELVGVRLRHQARLLSAVACAQVPKLTVIVGNSFGCNNYLMGGKSMDPRFLFMWPTAKVAIESPDQMIEKVIQEQFPEGVDKDSDAFKAFEEKVVKRLKLTSSAMFSSSRLWDDGIILPQQTRQVLGQCLRIVRQGGPVSDMESAVIRL